MVLGDFLSKKGGTKLNTRIFVILLAMALLLLIPNVAFATVTGGGYVERKMGEGMAYIATLIFKPVFDDMVTALGAMMSTPDLDSLSNVSKFLFYTKILAYSLLTVNLIFRAWRFQTGKVFGGQTEPLPDLLWRTLLSAILIEGLPQILKLLIKLNNALIQLIKTEGKVDFTAGLKVIAFPNGGAQLLLIICVVIFTIALVALTVSNAIRLAELVFLYLFAPIMAVSHAGKGESFQIWIMQAVSVSLTQSIQFLLTSFALNFAANISYDKWYSYLLPIGSIVLAIRGPQLLKQFLYSTGVGGVGTGAAKSFLSTALYTKMMKG